MNVAVASTPVRGARIQRPYLAAAPAGGDPGGHHSKNNKDATTTTTTNNNNSAENSSQLLLKCGPLDAAVDYDTDITPLYECIGNSDWDAAIAVCRSRPGDAATWVVRYNRDSNGNKVVGPNGKTNVLWRFLPIHSACALNPPAAFLQALLRAHPNGSRTLDDQGMLPLHYACGAKCTREVLYSLLMSFPQAALKEDPNGMLPLHYLAQWGPMEGSSTEAGVIDMVCVATGHKVGTARDGDGNTAEMLARRAEYGGHKEVARKIREFAGRYATMVGGGSVPSTPREAVNTHLPPTPSRGSGSDGFTPIRSGGSVNFNFDGEAVNGNAGRGNRSVKTSTMPGNASDANHSAATRDASFHNTANPHHLNTTPDGVQHGTMQSNGNTADTIDGGGSSDRGGNLSVITPMPVVGPIRSSTPDRELVGDLTLIEHGPGGGIEISLSNASRLTRSDDGGSCHDGVVSGGGHEDYGRDRTGNAMMAIPQNDNHIMSKLGVSPVYSKHESRPGDKDRYHSWAGHSASNVRGGGDDRGSSEWDTGLNLRGRSFSWDQADSTASNFDSEARNTAPNAAATASVQNTSSISGNIWTTTVDLPRASDVGGSPNNRSRFGNGALNPIVTTDVGLSSASQQRSSSTPRSYAPSDGAVVGAGGHPSTCPRPLQQRSISTPRAFASSSGAVEVDNDLTRGMSDSSIAASSGRIVGDNVTQGRSSMASNAVNSAGNSTAPKTGQKSYSRPVSAGLPPLSPRKQKLWAQRKWNYSVPDSPQSQQRLVEEEREPAHSAAMNEKESQDQILLELRDELANLAHLVDDRRSGSSDIPTIGRQDIDESNQGRVVPGSDGSDREVECGASIQGSDPCRPWGSASSSARSACTKSAASVRSDQGNHWPVSEHLSPVHEAPSSVENENDSDYSSSTHGGASSSAGNTGAKSPSRGGDRSGNNVHLPDSARNDRGVKGDSVRPGSLHGGDHRHHKGVAASSVQSGPTPSTDHGPSNRTLTSGNSESPGLVSRGIADRVGSVSRVDSPHPADRYEVAMTGNDQNDVASVISGRSKGTSSGSHSDTSYGTQPTQQLQKLDDVEGQVRQETRREEEETERLQLKKRELQEEIAQLASKRDRAATERRGEEEVQRRELQEEIARLKSEKDRAEGGRSEGALLEEIARLREDKKRTEEALGRITPLGTAPVEGERARSAKLQLQMTKLRGELEVANASQSEALREHLETVQSLRESLDKANIEVERLRDRERAASEEADELRAKKNEMDKELTSKLEVKEKEWKERCSKLEEEVKDANDKCWTAQNEECKLRTETKHKESEWEEQRERLEGEIKRLKEAGSDSFSVSSNTCPPDSSGSLSVGEHEVRALMKDKELKWNKERERLEAEISALKENAPSSVSSSDSDSLFELGGIGSTSMGTDRYNEQKNAAMKMQLENAVKEAEDMRKFNSAIRKEHGETVAELEAELEGERRGKTESLSQVVALQYQIATLEQDLEDARKDSGHGKTKESDLSRAIDGDSCSDRAEAEEVHQLKEQLRKKLQDAEESRKALDNMKVELRAKERKIEELEFQDKEKVLLQTAGVSSWNDHTQDILKAYESMKLEFKERENELQEELEQSRNLLDAAKEELKESEIKLQREAENARNRLNAAADEFKEREKKLRGEVRKARNLLDDGNGEFKESEKKLQEETLNAAKAEYKEKLESFKLEFKDKEKDLRMEVKRSHGLLESIKHDNKEREIRWQQRLDEAKETYLQQIHDLKKKIELLHHRDEEHSKQLWEANKLRERALQDKEDELATTVHDLKSKHEIAIMEKEDAFHEELRESKKRSEQLVRAQEESFLRQLREAKKKKEQEWAEREGALQRQIDEAKRVNGSFSELQIEKLMQQKEEDFEEDIEKIVQEKNDEFEKEVAELQSEIKRLRKQSKEATEDKIIAKELETQLLECKRELDLQRRKQKSEINKLKTTMELQKSKEGRLQSHIQSLEKQITNMVNEYESRLQDAFYDNM